MALSKAARYLRDYVAIPSVNPMGRQDIDPALIGEVRYARHVQAQLSQLGIDAELLGQGSRQSVVGQLQTRGGTDTLLVASHLDTVPVDGMTIDPFDPVVEKDRLYGRGASDTKGGMAALLAALDRVLKRGKLKRNLIVVGEADEEAGSLGIAEVIKNLAGRPVDWAIVTEPTGMRLVTHHKGCITARVVARGRACHGSDPDAGESAIVALARAVLAMQQEHARLRCTPDPRLGPATLSVGCVGGGQAVNVVPDEAWLLADRRSIPGDDPQRVQSQLQAAFAQAGLSEHVAVAKCWSNKEPLSTPDEAVGVLHCQAALRSCGLDAQPTGVAFGTDAGPLSLAGIPSVVLGPGDIEQAHTKDEWLPLTQLDAMTDFFVQLLS